MRSGCVTVLRPLPAAGAQPGQAAPTDPGRSRRLHGPACGHTAAICSPPLSGACCAVFRQVTLSPAQRHVVLTAPSCWPQALCVSTMDACGIREPLTCPPGLRADLPSSTDVLPSRMYSPWPRDSTTPRLWGQQSTHVLVPVLSPSCPRPVPILSLSCPRAVPILSLSCPRPVPILSPSCPNLTLTSSCPWPHRGSPREPRQHSDFSPAFPPEKDPRGSRVLSSTGLDTTHPEPCRDPSRCGKLSRSPRVPSHPVNPIMPSSVSRACKRHSIWARPWNSGQVVGAWVWARL